MASHPRVARVAFSLLAAAAAAPRSAASAAPSRICLQPPAQDACLSWTSDGTNISFVGSWPALPSPYGVGWGAWGISSISCGSMYPASVWMVLKGPSNVLRLEDRVTTAHAVPQCRKRQLSYVTASSVKPDGSFTVSWTRPLVAPPGSGQPNIRPGNDSLIGAAYFGTPLVLRPCEPSGIPAHTSVAAYTVQLLNAPAPARRAAPAPAPASLPAPAGAGLLAAVPVCTTGSSAANNFARVSPQGAEQFYGVAQVPGYLGVTAVDAAGRRLHAFSPNATGVGFSLASVDIDSGRTVSTCNTGVLVPTQQSLEDVGLAWDARGASLIVSTCTDAVCAGYVQVSRLQPGSCKLTPVVKVPTDPSANPQTGAAAFDAASGTYVMSLTQTIRGATGLVLVAVDVAAGSAVHVFNEAPRGLDIVGLVPEAGAPGVFVGVANFLDAQQYGLALIRYDANANTLTRAPAVPGYSGAMPGSAALNPTTDIFYFLAQDQHGTSIVGVHTANGTLASAGVLPGDAGQTPSAFFYA